MTDLERIQFIENVFCFSLKQVDPSEIGKKDFFSRNISFYSLSQIQNHLFPFKGSRNYCLNSDNRITGLSLDFSPLFLLSDNFLKDFNYLNFLSIRSSGLHDVSFLKELKDITSLDLSYNQLTDVSFLKELKGITSLDLSYNQLI